MDRRYAWLPRFSDKIRQCFPNIILPECDFQLHPPARGNIPLCRNLHGFAEHGRRSGKSTALVI